MKINKEDIVRIEKLARLKLPHDQEQDFSDRLTKVFDWIDQLREVDIEGVEPLVNPLMSLGQPTTAWRQDKVSDGDIQEQVIANAPGASYGSFTVPKVVE